MIELVDRIDPKLQFKMNWIKYAAELKDQVQSQSFNEKSYMVFFCEARICVIAHLIVYLHIIIM